MYVYSSEQNVHYRYLKDVAIGRSEGQMFMLPMERHHIAGHKEPFEQKFNEEEKQIMEQKGNSIQDTIHIET